MLADWLFTLPAIIVQVATGPPDLDQLSVGDPRGAFIDR